MELFTSFLFGARGRGEKLGIGAHGGRWATFSRRVRWRAPLRRRPQMQKPHARFRRVGCL